VIVADTHSIVWLTTAPHLLSRSAEQAFLVSSGVDGIAISDISLWEIARLAIRKRILIDRPLDDYLKHLESEFLILPITGRIAMKSMEFGRDFPRDPADRSITATALVHGVPLVTKDEEIYRSNVVDCIWR
jgi:PIN domain nuclease of toxin-antitoxin system